MTLVSDNQVNNYLKEIQAFVYYASIVNNQPKNSLSEQLQDTTKNEQHLNDRLRTTLVIKTLTAQVGRLSPSLGEENGPKR